MLKDNNRNKSDKVSKDFKKNMLAYDKNPAKVYQLFKVHKLTFQEILQRVGLLSVAQEVTQRIFVDNFLKPLFNLHPFYLQDTPDFF